MIILAIETSCDETAIAVLRADKNKFEILSNVVASQIKIHAPWGGVVPNLAKREHERNLPIVLRKALKEAGFANSNFQFSNPKIDLIAVTQGPGLKPCLWTGINFAENLAKKWKKHIIGINHMEGHIFSVFLSENRKSTKHEARSTKNSFGFRISNFGFPAMALLVSGGHTELVLIKKLLSYKVIGSTRDDAAGEAFDKVAKMLGLKYPGGPQIAELAARTVLGGKRTVLKLPRPMINSKDYDFSFSGLKTAVLYKIRELRIMNKELKITICHEFQQAVIDVLIKKTIRAAREYKVKTIILGGGVAANTELRKQLAEAIEKLNPKPYWLFPKPSLTTDNAAMIAVAAYFHRNDKLKKLTANGNLGL